MLDKRRLNLMIQMARFEEKNKDQAFRITNFFQRDYIALALIRNFLLTTIAFGLLIAVLAMYNLEELLAHLHELDVLSTVFSLAVAYLIMLGIYSVIVYTIEKLRYVRAEAAMKDYRRALGKLMHIYQEGSMREQEEYTEEL